MANTTEVIERAQQLAKEKQEPALEVLLGMLDEELTHHPELKDQVSYEPQYKDGEMGSLDDLKFVGLRVLNRWNKELHALVCGNKPEDAAQRNNFLASLSLGEAAVIGAVVTALLPLGVPPIVAAPLAAIIVKRFIRSGKDEVCQVWAERIARP